jgi:hypothetical protein
MTVIWDGTNHDGMLVPAGVYEYRLAGQDILSNRRLIVLR